MSQGTWEGKRGLQLTGVTQSAYNEKKGNQFCSLEKKSACGEETGKIALLERALLGDRVSKSQES